ncbi:MAG TPA: hypothetical protein VG099_16275, partial [Gemmataceae bacterium]|nr:hypothetical protein [Gemmataceae bacterium]
CEVAEVRRESRRRDWLFVVHGLADDEDIPNRLERLLKQSRYIQAVRFIDFDGHAFQLAVRPAKKFWQDFLGMERARPCGKGKKASRRMLRRVVPARRPVAAADAKVGDHRASRHAFSG